MPQRHRNNYLLDEQLHYKTKIGDLLGIYAVAGYA